MRDLKFRVWDTKLLIFSFPEEMDSLIGGYISNSRACRANPKTKPIAAFTLQDLDGRYKLQPFAGLKDKNGKEIYEGDIVMNGKKNWEVIWNDGGFFEIKDGEYLWEVCSKMEVIGNIFENSELLTKNPEPLKDTPENPPPEVKYPPNGILSEGASKILTTYQ